MKNKKILIAIIALSLLLAIFATAYASAEGAEPTLKIFSKNLSYRGTISIAFAVEVNGASANDVSLLVYDSEPKSESDTPSYTVTESLEETVHGIDALVFFTKGIAAKDMPDEIYVRAKASIDGKDYYSPVERYSVAEYAYDILYRSNLGEEYDELAKHLIGIGDSIQTLLPHDTENKPSDFLYAAVEYGTLDGIYNSGLYKSGESITLKYNGDDAFLGFTVNYISKSGKVTTQNVPDNTTINLTDCHVVAYPASAFADFESGATTAENLTLGRGEFEVVTDPRDPSGKVLHAISYDPALGSSTVDSDHAYIRVLNKGDYAEDELYATFSGDFYVQNNGKYTNWALEFIFEDVGVADWVYAFDMLGGNNGTTMNMKHYGTEGEVFLPHTDVLASRWFNLRIDYHRNGTQSTMTVYINGQCVVKDLTAYKTDSETNKPIDYVEIRFRENDYVFYADNLSLESSSTAPTPPAAIGDGFGLSSVPSYITVPSSGTGVTIEKSPTDSKDNVLKFTQSATSNTPRPILFYNGVSDIDSPYNTLVSDVYIQRGTKTGTMNELFFGCDGGGEAFRLKVVYASDGIHLKKWYKDESGAEKIEDFATAVILPENKWFELRFDYYLDGVNSYLNVYLDGVLAASESSYYWNHQDTTGLTKSTRLKGLSWQVNMGSNGYAWYFDDFSFVKNLDGFIK